MSRKNYLFTSESVSEGHPDKVCDRISDEIVDLFFREALEQGMDPAQVRVACETFATTNRVVIGGETRGPASVTHEKIEAAARQAIKSIGYEQSGFHWQTARIEILLHGQSACRSCIAVSPGSLNQVQAPFQRPNGALPPATAKCVGHNKVAQASGLAFHHRHNQT